MIPLSDDADIRDQARRATAVRLSNYFGRKMAVAPAFVEAPATAPQRQPRIDRIHDRLAATREGYGWKTGLPGGSPRL